MPSRYALVVKFLPKDPVPDTLITAGAQKIQLQTHPSVRIKGTENNYTPNQCFDPLCMDKSPHMHCPFCVKTDCYSDPVILKAHYRVKHVDKGIEFAGLKVLRCCDHCDIVGVIKGEKKFKGAHWHCYKCRNGFNRRDEAIKHYKTHFRNPQTTFQIQISQEVNQPLTCETEDPTSTIPPAELQIHPALTEAITCMVSADDQTFHQSSHITLSNKGGTEIAMPVAANETVGVGESQSALADTQTVMIIQDDGTLTSFTEQYSNQAKEEVAKPLGIMESEPPSPVPEEQEPGDLQKLIDNLELRHSEQQKEIEQLKLQIEERDHQIAEYQRREQELLNQLSIPLDKGIQQLLQQLEASHKDLLHNHLAQLKRTYLSVNNITDVNSITSVNTITGINNNNSVNNSSKTTPQIFLINSNSVPNNVNDQSSVVTIQAGDNTDINEINNADSGLENRTIEPSSGDIPDSNELDTINGVKIHIVKSADESDRDFGIDLDSTYNESVSDDALHIESDTIPVENEGNYDSPPTKRRKES